LHRLDGPARIAWNKNGTLKHELWYFFSKLHRDDGPAFIVYGKNNNEIFKEWYIHGEKKPGIILNEWHKYWADKKHTFDESFSQLMLEQIAYFNGESKIYFRINSKKKGIKLIIEITDVENKNICLLLTVDLTSLIGHIEFFTPYNNACSATCSPSDFMKILDLLCDNIHLKELHLYDMATVNLCKKSREPRIMGNDLPSLRVPLSVITFIKTEKYYYERFGFHAVKDEREENMKMLTEIIKVPADIVKFIGLTSDSKFQTILRACLLKYDEKCGEEEIPNSVSEWIWKKLVSFSLDIPNKFIKTKFV
jgi:hypothetical protein